MADKEEASGDNTTRDWEVVSLTASAYAAAPGPNQKLVESKDDDDDGMEAETYHPLYMSRHFVFPPSEHSEIYQDKARSKMMDFGFPVEQGGDLTLKGLDLGGLEFFEEKGKSQENIYKTAMEDERAIGVYQQDEPIHEQTEPVTSHVSPPTKDEVAPCDPWWKRSAASLISQARETNTVWSIFIAAAVMGVVILGQQERWQILQLKWESSIGNEKARRLMGPIVRLKQVFSGGQRRDSFIRLSSPNDN